ncbi:MAG: sigma-54-dependent Fis family transcriptional regulator [Candidatus Hydrogenedentota bacterium]|nr:MAG: sigma-54-dependent Fis family transcriptional regulator [Candidatus Hydrogenedentota bacterium]
MRHERWIVKRPKRILVAEDEIPFRRTAVEALRDRLFHVEEASDGDEAWRLFRRHQYDAVLTDIRMPGMDGLTLLDKIHETNPGTPVMVVTAFGSLDTAVEALRRGARDYVTKPCDLDELCFRVERMVNERLAEQSLVALQKDTRAELFDRIVGESPLMRETFRLIEKVAPTTSTVLIVGESGTGKELVAREIHRRSGLDRFVPVNCGAIPENLLESELFGHRKGAFTGATANKEGLFRLADQGTLFLDEVGELPLALQVKLLRALDSGEVQPVGAPGPVKASPRVLAATNRNLQRGIEEGWFREDLYYRLNVIEIKIPPLRERTEDIPALVEHFIRRFAKRTRKPIRGITQEALSLLQTYPWRGNVRELENVIERAVILSDGNRITVADLPAGFDSPEPVSEQELCDLRTAVMRFERDLILKTIRRMGGDKKAAAGALGIGLSSLYRKLETPV